MTDTRKRYASIREYIETNGLKKGFTAQRWQITRWQMTALLYPGRYPVSLTGEQWNRIAMDLNKQADEIKKQYGKAA